MVAKKPSVERAWKIAAIDRLIAEERSRSHPCTRRLAELQRLKRRPSHLLTAAHILADVDTSSRRSLIQISNDLTLELERHERGSPGWHATMRQLGFVRLKLHPRGSEHVLAALEAERTRVVAKYESVDVYFKRQRAQQAKASKPREAGNDGRTTSQLVADVEKSYPDYPSREVIPHVQAAIEASGKEHITDKWARELIARARRARESKRRRS